MSVMAQLKKFAENPEGPVEGEPTESQGKFDRSFLKSSIGNTEGSEELDSMLSDNPIPGQSLTQDPNQRLPYEGPPRFTDQRPFIDHLFNQLSNEDVLPGILQTMRKEVPVEDVARKVLRKQLMNGNINPDLMLLSIEPTIYMLIALATYAGIDPILYPEGDFDEEDSDATMSSKFKEGAERLIQGDVTEAKQEGITVTDLQAPSVLPRSLMSRTQEALESIGGPSES